MNGKKSLDKFVSAPENRIIHDIVPFAEALVQKNFKAAKTGYMQLLSPQTCGGFAPMV